MGRLGISIKRCWGNGYGVLGMKLIICGAELWPRNMGTNGIDGLQNQVEDHMDVAYGAVLEKDGTLFSSMWLLR